MKSFNKPTTVSYALLFAVQLLYGANYTIAKELMPLYIGPRALILVRVGVALILFYIYARIVAKDEKILASDRLRFVFCALFGVATNMICFFSGLELTSPVNAAVIMTTTPILVSIIAFFWYKEQLSLLNVAGIIIGFAGAVWMILSNRVNLTAGGDVFGDILILINASSYALYLVIVRPLLMKYNAIFVVSRVFIFGFIMVLPFGLLDWETFRYTEMPSWAWGSLAYVVIGTTFLAYLFNILGLKNLRASVVGSFIYLQPILATLVAVGSGRYKLVWFQIAAGILVAVGVYLSTRKVTKAIQ